MNTVERTLQRTVFYLAVAVSLTVAAYRLLVFSAIEPTTWDVYSFLDLARALSDLSFSDTLWLEGDRPLLLPLLASFLMLLGLKSGVALYLPAAVLFVIGAVSFFLLLRMRLSPGLSLLGLTIFLLNPLVLNESASGMTNLPGTGLSILAIYLMLRAKERPEFYVAVLPVVLLAALTRYTAGLLLLPVLLFLLTAEYRDRFAGLRQHLGRGAIFAAIMYVPFGIYFYVVIKSFFWPLLLSVHASKISSSLRPAINHPELSYYVARLPGLISDNAVIGNGMAFLALAASVIFLARIVAALDLKNRIFLALAVPAFFARSSMLTLIALVPPFFSLLKIRYALGARGHEGPHPEQGRSGAPLDDHGRQAEHDQPSGSLFNGNFRPTALLDKYIFREGAPLDNYHIVMMLWFLTFLIFHSISIIKLDRYFLTMLPPLIVIALLVVDELRERLVELYHSKTLSEWRKRFGALVDIDSQDGRGYMSGWRSRLASLTETEQTWPNQAWLGAIPGVLLSLIVLFLAFNSLSALSEEQQSYAKAGAAIKQSLADHPELRESSVTSNMYPLHAWYLGRFVEPMSYYFGATRKGRITATEHKLSKEGYEYYLSVHNFELNGFSQFYNNDEVNLYYYRKSAGDVADGAQALSPPQLPDAFLIGNGWQRNLESLAGYAFNLRFDLKPPSGLGGYRIGTSNYVDNYTLRELARYPVIFAFNFRWHDRDKMEQLLNDYVVQGGVLVIDASGNLRSPLSVINLRNRKLFGIDVSKIQTGSSVELSLTGIGTPFPATGRLELVAPLEGATYTDGYEVNARDPAHDPLDSESNSSQGVDDAAGTNDNLIAGANEIRDVGDQGTQVLAELNGDPLIAEQTIGDGKVIWVGADLFRSSVRQKDPQLLDLTKRVIELSLSST